MQIKLGQSVQGVQEWMLPGDSTCQEGGAVGDKVTVILSLEGSGDERGIKYITTTRGAVGGQEWLAILAQGQPNLI